MSTSRKNTGSFIVIWCSGARSVNLDILVILFPHGTQCNQVLCSMFSSLINDHCNFGTLQHSIMINTEILTNDTVLL